VSLREIFEADLRQQIGFQFTEDAIQWRFPGFTIHGEVVLDRGDFAGLVSAMGGVPWSGTLLGGMDVLRVYDAIPPEAADQRLSFQEQLMTALFTTLAQQNQTPEAVVTYIRQVPQVQSNAASLSVLDSFAADAPPIAASTIICRTYQPQMEIGAQP
jgi:hypothetical protein